MKEGDKHSKCKDEEESHNYTLYSSYCNRTSNMSHLNTNPEPKPKQFSVPQLRI